MATRPNWAFRTVVNLVRPLATLLLKRSWSGQEHLPTDRGFIAVSNHVSYVDPLTFGHYLYNSGHPPRFLAKKELFEIPVVGRVLKSGDQIPVYRGTSQAKDSLDYARVVLDRGDMIAMFPEGTLTRDPNMWPMVARTGAARLALESGAPVIPVAQWGAHLVLPPYSKKPDLFPRKPMVVRAGPAIDLDDLRGKPIDTELLRIATDRIMATLTAMVADIRGETPPEHPFDMRAHQAPKTDNAEGAS
ncbi:lysophospholipid acyltransferase family protein [Demequina sp.]|uniref:lysophospholipid acyltransferase family protein n=1 Tax=Demequina sp. TaxID=2050685 RepID=UPI003D0EC409